MVTRRTRNSDTFPGLTLVLEGSDRGTFATFRYGVTFEAFQLDGDRAIWIDCSDRFTMPAEMVRHCREAVRAIASKLSAKEVA